MSKIVDQVSQNPKLVAKVYTSLNLLTSECCRSMVQVFDELIKLESDPNPLAIELAVCGDDFVNELLVKLETETGGSNYSRILRILTLQPQLHACLLRKEVVK
uniref:Uncharacterized protein n=1 Tax=Euplotes harpa TaxID=151035 RepID=A0A7S3N9S2_9SPIT|mmetsp:Transcript_38027/g.43679  ORF Transcript_38027/g.43679 Transcript_38027/m.43679 type:complete len:103 (+) Transcript_38027:3-311(+)